MRDPFTAALQMALQDLGEICWCKSDDAFTHLSKDCYDGIVVDSGQIGNIETYIRNLLAICPDACVIILTGSPTWRRARDTLQAGAADYGRKTTDPNRLRQFIWQAMQRHAAQIEKDE
jgi:DNA-binding NtrC family response regulator